jgi:hypothetical protein
MPRKGLWLLAKFLELAGMMVVLVGLLISIQLGLREEGLASMKYEGTALLVGGGMFVLGWFLERGLRSR